MAEELSLSPRAGYHHVDVVAAALRAHKPLAPVEDRRLSTVSLRLLSGVGLDLMSPRFELAQTSIPLIVREGGCALIIQT